MDRKSSPGVECVVPAATAAFREPEQADVSSQVCAAGKGIRIIRLICLTTRILATQFPESFRPDVRGQRIVQAEGVRLSQEGIVDSLKPVENHATVAGIIPGVEGLLIVAAPPHVVLAYYGG
jgi:hypothetical protein